MKLYLTVFEADSGHAQPVGYVGETQSKERPPGVRCPTCDGAETFVRLTLLTEFVMGMGYEVSFTTEPHTDPDAVHQSRRPNVPSEGYEEVS